MSDNSGSQDNVPEQNSHGAPEALGPGSHDNGLSIPKTILTPELRRWAEQFSDEEFIDGVNEIRKTGGLQLSEFIDELEAIVATNDSIK